MASHSGRPPAVDVPSSFRPLFEIAPHPRRTAGTVSGLYRKWHGAKMPASHPRRVRRSAFLFLVFRRNIVIFPPGALLFFRCGVIISRRAAAEGPAGNRRTEEIYVLPGGEKKDGRNNSGIASDDHCGRLSLLLPASYAACRRPGAANSGAFLPGTPGSVSDGKPPSAQGISAISAGGGKE